MRPGNSEDDLAAVGSWSERRVGEPLRGWRCIWRKWGAPEVFELGSHVAEGSCIWQQMGGDGHLAQEGSRGAGGGREECHECGSLTRLDG